MMPSAELKPFPERFLEIVRSLTTEVGLDHEASAEEHPRHAQYLVADSTGVGNGNERDAADLKKVGGTTEMTKA
jgi:hypothetical protein